MKKLSNQEMKKIAKLIDLVIKNIDDDLVISKVKSSVIELCNSFKLYPNL